MKNKGITLPEILIAILLLVLVLSAGSGIYLSGWQMFRDAQFIAQAQRNAMVPMMHMVKQLQQAAKFDKPFYIAQPGAPAPPPIIRFYVYTTTPDFNAGPTIIRQYTYITDGHQIIYFPDLSNPSNFQVVGTRIHNFDFNISHDSAFDGAVVTIEITARDNKDNEENEFVLSSVAEARYASIPTAY